MSHFLRSNKTHLCILRVLAGYTGVRHCFLRYIQMYCAYKSTLLFLNKNYTHLYEIVVYVNASEFGLRYAIRILLPHNTNYLYSYQPRMRKLAPG